MAALRRPSLGPQEFAQLAAKRRSGKHHAIILAFCVGSMPLERFGRPAWWVTVTYSDPRHNEGKSPIHLEALPLMTRVRVRQAAERALEGVGDPARQFTQKTGFGFHLIRACSNSELGAADLTRMAGPLRDPCAQCGALVLLENTPDNLCPSCTHAKSP